MLDHVLKSKITATNAFATGGLYRHSLQSFKPVLQLVTFVVNCLEGDNVPFSYLTVSFATMSDMVEKFLANKKPSPSCQNHVCKRDSTIFETKFVPCLSFWTPPFHVLYGMASTFVEKESQCKETHSVAIQN